MKCIATCCTIKPQPLLAVRLPVNRLHNIQRALLLPVHQAQHVSGQEVRGARPIAVEISQIKGCAAQVLSWLTTSLSKVNVKRSQVNCRRPKSKSTVRGQSHMLWNSQSLPVSVTMTSCFFCSCLSIDDTVRF